MKAVTWTKYGNPKVLKIQDINEPTPTHNELLIKIFSSAVTTGDCRMRKFDIPKGFWFPARLAVGIFKPRRNIAEIDFSGEVITTGKDVILFKKGDKVFGSTGIALGTNAKYACIAEDKAVKNTR